MKGALAGVAALGAVAATEVPAINSAEAGTVSQDIKTRAHGEVTFNSSRTAYNIGFEKWVDTFLMKDPLFVDQIKKYGERMKDKYAVEGELKYEMSTPDDGDLLAKIEATGGAPALEAVKDFKGVFVTIKPPASVTDKGSDMFMKVEAFRRSEAVVSVGFQDAMGKKTQVLHFFMPVDGVPNTKK